jgi:ubiquinone/menaquinone biosynthesis C-methylase UbiE
MNAELEADGQRSCSRCGELGRIGANEKLWPEDWRCRKCDFEPPKANGAVQLAPDLDDVHEGFDLRNFDLLPQVENDHLWFISRNELIRWLVQRFAPKAHRVLEIGCGTGFVISALREALPLAQIAASELHSVGLTTARARQGDAVELFQMDARKSCLSNVLDLVGAFDVLEHIPQDEAVLTEIQRMLKPGGLLIATVPQHPWMWSTTDDLAHHERRYCIGELARKASAAGLEPIYQSSFTVLALPLMIASRFIARMKPVPRTLEQQTDAEYRMTPGVTRLMLGVARFEHRLRRLGFPMPFGGSQVIVARRPHSEMTRVVHT